MKTKLTIDKQKLKINGKLIYSEIEGNSVDVHGLMMNARFIQGIFDDKENPQKYARFGWKQWDPERHTDELIKALPLWYSYGLRAFTVGLQGGMPVFTIENSAINNNPFSDDGLKIDPSYLNRLDRLIRAADEIGMIVIVSLFYQGQSPRMKTGTIMMNAVKTASQWLKDQNYTNIIIEIANEHTVGNFKNRPVICDPESIITLMEISRQASGGIPAGCSEGGAEMNIEVARASDIILIHGNNARRQSYCNFIKKVKSWTLNKPIVCNEDSPCFTNLDVAIDTQTSWGYYNNLSKQEPPADWGIANAEDLFFARRMAGRLGIKIPKLPEEEQYILDGVTGRYELNGERWVRLSAEYPELINYVDFFQNGKFIDRAYDEPFYVNFTNTWTQSGYKTQTGDIWNANIYLLDGRVLERKVKAE
ncbi:MAG: glycoside hydrolase family 5 protein [Treponema sp.]|nr:glycoside hydrolase family 5 protein [Treponema sp.]